MRLKMAKSRGSSSQTLTLTTSSGPVACLTEGLHEVVQRLPGLFRDAADHKFPFGVFRDLTGDEQPAVRLHRLRSGHAALLGQTKTLNASHKFLLSSLGRAVAPSHPTGSAARKKAA